MTNLTTKFFGARGIQVQEKDTQQGGFAHLGNILGPMRVLREKAHTQELREGEPSKKGNK
jgi:hypothetical protein